MNIVARYIVISLLAIPPMFVSAQAGFLLPTTEIMEQCRSDSEVENAQCLAYMRAIADALSTNAMEMFHTTPKGSVERMSASVCLPSDLEQDDLRRAFLIYADLHPNIEDTNPAYVAAAAFTVAWPCDE